MPEVPVQEALVDRLATHLAARGCAVPPVEMMQQHVGHASLDTTTRYVRPECARRLQAMAVLLQ
ncbi:hypothetical protein [Cupriavidus sp. TMH.W2]|uniref:hypothetical protein n=1 Tax=Cupriavidus sp. TMH.W2 TaxID=3434465 RepID=UPI003D788BB1